MQVASEEMHLTLLPAARDHLLAGERRADRGQRPGDRPAVDRGRRAVRHRASASCSSGPSAGCTRRTHRRINTGCCSRRCVAGRLRSVAGRRVRGGPLRSSAGPRARLGAGRDARPGGHRRPAGPRRRGAQPDLAQRRASFQAGLSPCAAQRSAPARHAARRRAAASLAGRAGARARVGRGHAGRAAWYAANEQGLPLDLASRLRGRDPAGDRDRPGSSAAAFGRLETDLSRGIAADQVVFHSNAASGGECFQRPGGG